MFSGTQPQEAKVTPEIAVQRKEAKLREKEETAPEASTGDVPIRIARNEAVIFTLRKKPRTECSNNFCQLEILANGKMIFAAKFPSQFRYSADNFRLRYGSGDYRRETSIGLWHYGDGFTATATIKFKLSKKPCYADDLPEIPMFQGYKYETLGSGGGQFKSIGCYYGEASLRRFGPGLIPSVKQSSEDQSL